jgi:hypothetical protein
MARFPFFAGAIQKQTEQTEQTDSINDKHNTAYQTLIPRFEESNPPDVCRDKPMPDAFIGLSRMSLQDAKLARLSRLANLRKASRQYREALSDARSEMALLHHELEVIEQQLERIVQFPTTSPATVEAKHAVHRLPAS